MCPLVIYFKLSSACSACSSGSAPLVKPYCYQPLFPGLSNIVAPVHKEFSCGLVHACRCLFCLDSGPCVMFVCGLYSQVLRWDYTGFRSYNKPSTHNFFFFISTSYTLQPNVGYFHVALQSVCGTEEKILNSKYFV